jgi:hypothetical protein
MAPCEALSGPFPIRLPWNQTLGDAGWPSATNAPMAQTDISRQKTVPDRQWQQVDKEPLACGLLPARLGPVAASQRLEGDCGRDGQRLSHTHWTELHAGLH